MTSYHNKTNVKLFCYIFFIIILLVPQSERRIKYNDADAISSDDDEDAPPSLPPPTSLKHDGKTKRNAANGWFPPHNQLFSNYLNAFAINVMEHAYGLNNNFLNGFGNPAAYFYPPAYPRSPNTYMYPPPPPPAQMLMPPFSSKLDSIRRSYIPPGLIPPPDFYHVAAAVQPSLKDSIHFPIDLREEEIPGFQIPVAPFITEAEAARDMYVHNLLHTPLKVLAKKHRISMKKRENKTKLVDETVNNDLNSLIKDLGEFNRTVKLRNFTTAVAEHRIGKNEFDEAIKEMRDASLSTNTDGTSVFRYVVRNPPNATSEIRRSGIARPPQSSTPVKSLIRALRSKIRFEKDLIKSFVNYICDKKCTGR